MNHLYNIIVELVDKLILPILSLFSKKINRFRTNRIDLIEKIKNELTDKNENILGIKFKSFRSISEGIQFVANQFPNCQVLICGSLYLAGRILSENQ